MAVSGSLATMSTIDLLEWIERRQLVGHLLVERGLVSRRFAVAGTVVTSVSSTDPAERLGQLLLDRGALDEPALRAAFATHERTGVSLGRILVDGGLVEPELLRRTIDLKVREGLYDAMSWTDGTFLFQADDGDPPPAELPVAVPIRSCLAEGAERAERWRLVRRYVPDDEARFWLPDPTVLERVEPTDAELLAQAARGLSVREITLERHALPFTVHEALAALVGAGHLRLERRRTPRTEGTSDPAGLLAAARRHAAGGDRWTALDLGRQAVVLAPADEEIRRGFAELERTLLAEQSRRLLGRYRVPRLARPPADLEREPLTPEERYLVGRIDGRWDLLSLVRVAPLREAEALLAFARLADRGLVHLD